MKLIFIYNANSGILDRMIDNAHKIMSPSSYDCNLCAITFGKFTEDDLWKTFRKSSSIDMEFYHKDEFKSQLKSKWLPNYDFPLVLAVKDQEIEVFISKETLDTMQNSEALIEEIRKRSLLFK